LIGETGPFQCDLSEKEETEKTKKTAGDADSGVGVKIPEVGVAEKKEETAKTKKTAGDANAGATGATAKDTEKTKKKSR
jgi:hypothetical protein